MPVATERKSPAASSIRVISSPEDIVTVAAGARLMKSSYFEIRRVSCEFHEGVLTLRGCVSCYYLKQVAQSLVSRIAGVVQIDNQLDVAPLPS